MTVTFAKAPMMTEDDLKEHGWRLVNVGGTWVGRNTDGRKFKAGTRQALVSRLSYEIMNY